VLREILAEPLWTYAKSVEPTYVIVQCTDDGKLKYTRNSDALDNKSNHSITPLVVRMGKPPTGQDWVFECSTLKDKKTQAGNRGTRREQTERLGSENPSRRRWCRRRLPYWQRPFAAAFFPWPPRAFTSSPTLANPGRPPPLTVLWT